MSNGICRYLSQLVLRLCCKAGCSTVCFLDQHKGVGFYAPDKRFHG